MEGCIYGCNYVSILRIFFFLSWFQIVAEDSIHRLANLGRFKKQGWKDRETEALGGGGYVRTIESNDGFRNACYQL